jgi:colicin import membrane protein
VQAAPVEAATPPPKTTPTPPKTTTAAKPPPDAIPNFSKKVVNTAIRRESRIMQKYEKEKAAEERKRKEEELKSQRITQAEFDARNKSSSSKVRHIDTEGVINGSRNTSGATKEGANGTADTREEGDASEAYQSMMHAKLREQLDEKSGISKGLMVEVEIRILASGAITDFRILRSSGSTEFDNAVRDAFGAMRMPPRPTGVHETMRFPVWSAE